MSESESGNAAAAHGTRYAYRKRKCRCDKCRAWKSAVMREANERNREARQAARRSRWLARKNELITANNAWRKRQNDKARDKATRHHFEWTGTELEIAAREDLTARQVAGLTGRTISAVRNMRARLKDDLD